MIYRPILTDMPPIGLKVQTTDADGLAMCMPYKLTALQYRLGDGSRSSSSEHGQALDCDCLQQDASCQQ